MGPFRRGLAAVPSILATLFVFVCKTILYTVGIAFGLVSMGIGMLNCGVEAFIIGLMIWLLWDQCLVAAFSPYLVGQISYLEAVGIFVLFRIFFGGNNKPKDLTPRLELSGEEEKLVSTYREIKAGRGPGHGERQTYRSDQAAKSAAGNGAGCGDGACGGR